MNIHSLIDMVNVEVVTLSDEHKKRLISYSAVTGKKMKKIVAELIDEHVPKVKFKIEEKKESGSLEGHTKKDIK